MTVQRFGPDSSVDDVTAALDEHGVAVVENLLSTDEVTKKRTELERLVATSPIGRNDFEGFRTYRIYALLGKTRVFDDMVLHPLVIGACDEVLEYYQLSAPVGLQLQPGETKQILHYDDLIYPLPWPHQHVVLSVLWSLCDFTEANGATRLVPNSHNTPREREPTEDEALSIEMPAGSALMYVGSTWHGGGANSTDAPRPSALIVYNASWLRPQENHILAVPPATVRTLPPELQELLGYNVYPPFVGNVDGRHPRRVLA